MGADGPSLCSWCLHRYENKPFGHSLKFSLCSEIRSLKTRFAKIQIQTAQSLPSFTHMNAFLLMSFIYMKVRMGLQPKDPSDSYSSSGSSISNIFKVQWILDLTDFGEKCFQFLKTGHICCALVCQYIWT